MVKKKLIITISLVCSILLIIGATFLWSYLKTIENWRKEALGIDDIEIKERQFAENPDIQLALTLLDRYTFVESIKDLDKAEFYGNQAIELGADDTGYGFLANIWLASVYHEKGNEIKACHLFIKAKGLQNIERNNVINKKLAEDMGFKDEFIDNCQDLEKQIKKSSPTSGNP